MDERRFQGVSEGLPRVRTLYDPGTFTCTHLVIDPATGEAAVIDPVLDFDPRSGRTSNGSTERLLEAVAEEGVRVRWLLETHVHADHLTAADALRQGACTGAPLAIGEHVTEVQRFFGKIFNAGPRFVPDGRQFDRLLGDGATLALGELSVRVLHTPGHTPACVTYVVGDAAFVGDTLFMPDYGTARCDFPGGSARALYRSIRRILSLPDPTRLFMCHDYMPGGRDARWETTVAEERRANVHVRDGVEEEAFVRMREARDATLDMPTLLLPAVQVNMRGGAFPPPEDNGLTYLKLPVDAL